MDFTEPVPAHDGDQAARVARRRHLWALVLFTLGLSTFGAAVVLFLAPELLLQDRFVLSRPGPAIFVALALPGGPLMLSRATWLSFGHLTAGRMLMHVLWVFGVFQTLCGRGVLAGLMDAP